MRLAATKLDISEKRTTHQIQTNIFSGKSEVFDQFVPGDHDKWLVAKKLLILWRKRTIKDSDKFFKTAEKFKALCTSHPELFTLDALVLIQVELGISLATFVDDSIDSITYTTPSISPMRIDVSSTYGISPMHVDPSSIYVGVPSTKIEVDAPTLSVEDEEIRRDAQKISKELQKDRITKLSQKLIDFFSEFDFEPNFRFVNSISQFNSTNEIQSYISNYFALTDNPYKNSIDEKMKSYEFAQLSESLEKLNPSNKINSRFKLYYGSQGTGKTTKALEESSNVCMVCHSAMLPSDLMEDFKFEDGKAIFTPSALQNAMTNGTIITLDEINLLPFESLRFLQSILDGKKEFIYKGQTIEIKDGFKVIGTMNLKVNGSTFSLPEPLVDRAEDLKEFKLTAENLASALI